MPMDAATLEKALALYQPDLDRIELGRRRQDAIWHDTPPDKLPILFAAPVPEQSSFPSFAMDEEFHDPRVMLYNGLWNMIGVARSHSDSVPSLRANFGTALVASVFGLESEVFPDKMPWLKRHLTKEQIERFELPRDLSCSGYLPRIRETYQLYRSHLDGRGFCYIGDTQGPFDLAHLVRGDELFYDLHDDPQFVHHLVRLCTEAYIGATRAMKAHIGEPAETAHHSGCLWLGRGGARICEDTSTLLRPEHVDEFVVPYTRQAAAAFGGAWVHYCGDNARLLDVMIDEIAEVRGVNFGNPERHDPRSVLRRLIERAKCYVGGWPRQGGESLQRYFQRHLDCLDGSGKGLIFMAAIDWTKDDATPDSTVNLWHSLQE